MEAVSHQLSALGAAIPDTVAQTVRATRLVTRDRGPTLQGRCATLSGLTSSDHPDPRGLHPGLFYSTLSASSMSIAAGIREASPPPVNQWTDRHGPAQLPGAVRRTRPRRDSTAWSRPAPGRSTSDSTPKGLNGMVTPGPRAQYVGLDPEGTEQISPGCTTPGRIGSAARPNPEGVGQRSPRRTTSLQSTRHGHAQLPGAVRRTRPRRGSNRSARGANPGEDRICRKAQP